MSKLSSFGQSKIEHSRVQIKKLFNSVIDCYFFVLKIVPFPMASRHSLFKFWHFYKEPNIGKFYI